MLHIEETSAELEAVLARHHLSSWAFVTAHNPGSVPQSEAENRTRQAALEREVGEAGYPFYHGEGAAPDGSWPPEPSLLVLGIGRDEALNLARRHGQHALLFGVAGGPAQLLWV